MKEHKGNSDKITNVKLESSINRIIWTAGAACAGAKVGVEVLTQFVGNNSEIVIEISDKSGKKYEAIKRKISGNKFWTEITVPEKAKDELYAEAKLSKLGLNKKSNSLYLYPSVKITNVNWDKKEAKREDILKLSADIKGLADGNEAEIQIWEHDDDGVHDLITKFPCTIKNGKIEADWEFQYLGETKDIPTKDECEKGYQQPQYYFRVKAAEVYGDSGLLKFVDWIEIKLTDYDGYPMKDVDYELYLPDGTVKKGKLDENGYAKVENVLPGKYEVKFPGLKWDTPEFNPPSTGGYGYKAD